MCIPLNWDGDVIFFGCPRFTVSPPGNLFLFLVTFLEIPFLFLGQEAFRFRVSLKDLVLQVIGFSLIISAGFLTRLTEPGQDVGKIPDKEPALHSFQERYLLRFVAELVILVFVARGFLIPLCGNNCPSP